MKTTYTQEEMEHMVNSLNAKRLEVIRELQLQIEGLQKEVSIHGARVKQAQDQRDDALRLNDELVKQISAYRRMLWVLARRDELILKIPKADVELVPENAELLEWFEPLFDSFCLKGICTPINDPKLSHPVNEVKQTEKRICEHGDYQDSPIDSLCIKCGGWYRLKTTR